MKSKTFMYLMLGVLFVACSALSFIPVLRQPFPYPFLFFFVIVIVVLMISLEIKDGKKKEVHLSTNLGSFSIVPHKYHFTLESYKGLKVMDLDAYNFLEDMRGDKTLIYDESLMVHEDKLWTLRKIARFPFRFLPADMKAELRSLGCSISEIYVSIPDKLFMGYDSDDDLQFVADDKAGANMLYMLKIIAQKFNISDSHVELMGDKIDDFNDYTNWLVEQNLMRQSYVNTEEIAKKYLKYKALKEEQRMQRVDVEIGEKKK